MQTRVHSTKKISTRKGEEQAFSKKEELRSLDGKDSTMKFHGAAPNLGQIPLPPPDSPSQVQGYNSLLPLPALPLQRKLAIGAVHDPLEHEADLVADRVMRMPDPASIAAAPGSAPKLQRKCSCGSASSGECESCKKEKEGMVQRSATSAPPAEYAPPIVHDVLRSPGQPLDTATRSFFEPRLGFGLSSTRVHTDALAAESARSVSARAYTVGHEIVFGKGEFLPNTVPGRRLLAHELAHVAQQKHGAERSVRRSHLADFKDKDDQHDPSKLTDAQIQATDEFKSLMDSNLVWQWKDHVTKDEALLACRLMLRHLREGQKIAWDTDARTFVNLSRGQLGALKKTEEEVGKLHWVPFNSGAAASDPSQLQSDFGKWLLAGGPEPDAATGSVNCWEMVMFSAFKGKFTSKARIQGIYDEAVKQIKAGTRSFVGDTIEVELRRGNEYVLDPADPKSPEPLPGDIVIFSKAKNHVAISRGTKDASGRHAIVSHWPPPDGDYKTKITTIEELLASPLMAPGTVVKFWSPKW
jgi:hypothetical protein